MRFHTPPNMLTVIRCVRADGRQVSVATVFRKSEMLASYPADMNAGKIPTMQQVSKDAAWRDATGKILTK